ncbi:MAG: aldehyde dehydrogenase [Alistipes sp.]|nr:aldehyde dehydrogenase [Alistipes sp.]
MASVVDSFVELSNRLQGFGNDEHTSQIIDEACAANKWFTPTDIFRAVEAIREQFLNREKLQDWLSHYNIEHVQPKRVAIIMAGNIPLVGFFDLMCVLMCGHTALVKPSSKDKVLTEYIIGELKSISHSLPIENYYTNCECDMVIATGGDSAAAYFQSKYATTPSLIRGSRHSLAVLSGNETEADLKALSHDIFTYSGLGCRNVSLIMLPRGAELRLPEPDSANEMYRGCYLSSRALMMMTSQPHTDLGHALAVERQGFSDNISCINYCYYDSIEQVEQWLDENDEKIQCIVSRAVTHSRRVDFGRAQYPTLFDYADGVDVMKFLISN